MQDNVRVLLSEIKSDIDGLIGNIILIYIEFFQNKISNNEKKIEEATR
jgi:hypothetical protein